MRGITIAWREGAFSCEYRREPAGGWLHVSSGGELVAKEPAASVSAAYARARELSDALKLQRAKLA